MDSQKTSTWLNSRRQQTKRRKDMLVSYFNINTIGDLISEFDEGITDQEEWGEAAENVEYLIRRQWYSNKQNISSFDDWFPEGFEHGFGDEDNMKNFINAFITNAEYSTCGDVIHVLRTEHIECSRIEITLNYQGIDYTFRYCSPYDDDDVIFVRIITEMAGHLDVREAIENNNPWRKDIVYIYEGFWSE